MWQRINKARFITCVAAYFILSSGAASAAVPDWVRQAMTGAANAEVDEITAFCEDFTEDLKKISVPVLVLHGEDDQIVDPTRAPMSAELVKNGTLKTYPGYPHGMATTHADVINPDLLAFIRS